MTAPLWGQVPEEIFVDEAASADPLTDRVRRAFRSAQIIVARPESKPLSPAESYTQTKRRLFLSRYRGEWVKPCPGTSQHLCCNLYVVNPGSGCPYDCSYCHLQSYLYGAGCSELYTNTAEMREAIEQCLVNERHRRLRICTGELVDSLVWDDVTELSTELVPIFARQPNGVLELKTKSTTIGNLLMMRNEHCGKTVVSWSVNAEAICRREELYAPTLEARIEAAASIAEAGYPVGFHFDPVVYFDGWEDAYREAIGRIFSQLKAKSIAWISVATLRYPRRMQEVMRSRFPESKLPYGEQFLACDNKLRYIQPLRFRILRFLWQELKGVDRQLPVYFCMESLAAWRVITGASPTGHAELVQLFSRRADGGSKTDVY